MTSMIRVVLLAHNEGESIGSVLLQLRKQLTAAGSGFRVYVVNDGSTDDTVVRAERLSGSGRSAGLGQAPNSYKGSGPGSDALPVYRFHLGS